MHGKLGTVESIDNLNELLDINEGAEWTTYLVFPFTVSEKRCNAA